MSTTDTTGRIVRNTGAHYVVETPEGREINCKVKGNFRIKGLRTTNPVAVGDFVHVAPPGPDGTAYITDIADRRNYIVRRSINLSKQSHIIAANVDQAVLVASLAHPTTSTNFIDRFLATAEAYRVKAILCLNKTDLLTDPDDRELLAAVAHLYRTIGYDVVCTSARTGEGMDELRAALAAASSTLPACAASAPSTSPARKWPTISRRCSPSRPTAASTTARTCTSPAAPCAAPSRKAASRSRATPLTSASSTTPPTTNTASPTDTRKEEEQSLASPLHVSTIYL